jgi:hypothetical protein
MLKNRSATLGIPYAAADLQHHPLLVGLVQRIDRRRVEQLRLVRRPRRERSTIFVPQLPLVRVELLRGSARGERRRAVRPGIATLPVDGHRAGDHEPLELHPLIHQHLQKMSGTKGIRCRVVGDPVH